MTVAEARPELERLRARLWDCAGDDPDGDLRVVLMDIQGIADGDALTDAELAEDVEILARLVAEGTVPQEDADVFNVVAQDVRSRHEQVTPLLTDEIRAHGVTPVAKRVEDDLPDTRDARIIRTAFLDLALKPDFPNIAHLAVAAPAIAPRALRHRRAGRETGARRRTCGSGSRGSPGRPADGDDDPSDVAPGARPPEPTALQRVQQAFSAAMYAARDLDERGYSAFLDFAAALVAREAVRCAGWEADR